MATRQTNRGRRNGDTYLLASTSRSSARRGIRIGTCSLLVRLVVRLVAPSSSRAPGPISRTHARATGTELTATRSRREREAPLPRRGVERDSMRPKEMFIVQGCWFVLD